MSPEGEGAQVLLDRDAIAAVVTDIGARIGADHPDGIVLVGVLKGALVFLADLARAIPVEVTVDFLAISRYAPDSGRVKVLKDLDLDVAGRDLVIVEDLVDTGLTLAYLRRQLETRGARSVRCAALLDRPGRRILPQEVDYVGATIEADDFVLGYGLHWADRYRNLPAVYRVDRERLVRDPAAFVTDLYAGGNAAGRW